MNSCISSIEFYLPEKVLTNEELSTLYKDWSADKIFKKTGIKSRHIASKDECISDLAENAALKLFKANNIKPEEIDFILLATQSPDYILPTTACLLQNRLHIPQAVGALDINLGCSAFIYGMALAKSLIHTNIAKKILLITAEAYSKHINPMDKSTRTIFGDGAAATIISTCQDEKIGEFILCTDGSGADNLIIPAGGIRLPISEDTKIEHKDENGNIRTKKNIYMNGPEIFNFTIRVVPKTVKEVLRKNNLTIDDIDLFVFHQANKYILDYLKIKIKIPDDKFYVNLSETGNTVSASIPIALKMAEHEGRLKHGDLVTLVGFGVGLSWGAVVIKW